jgi:hypothetical protein
MIGEMVRGQSGKWLSQSQMKAVVEVLAKKGITKPSKDSYDDIARIVGKTLKALMKSEAFKEGVERPFEEGRRRSKSQRMAWMRAFADEMKKVLTGKVPLGHDGVPIGFDWNSPIHLFNQGNDPKEAALKVAKRYLKGGAQSEGVERPFDIAEAEDSPDFLAVKQVLKALRFRSGKIQRTPQGDYYARVDFKTKNPRRWLTLSTQDGQIFWKVIEGVPSAAGTTGEVVEHGYVPFAKVSKIIRLIEKWVKAKDKPLSPMEKSMAAMGLNL